VKRSEKNDFVQSLKEELKNSSSVVVAHYAGLSVAETDSLRNEMRSNGAKFKVTKNRLTKIALTGTPYESIEDLFTGPTAISYSSDPVAPARVSVEFEKKFENFKILGGSYEGEKNR
jgi:large subunit ribosomal protein L10